MPNLAPTTLVKWVITQYLLSLHVFSFITKAEFLNLSWTRAVSVSIVGGIDEAILFHFVTQVHCKWDCVVVEIDKIGVRVKLVL